jgi:hypothetical protein
MKACRELEVELHVFLTSTLDDVSVHHYAPADLTPKARSLDIAYKASGLQDGLNAMEFRNTSVCYRTPVTQLVVRRNTN